MLGRDPWAWSGGGGREPLCSDLCMVVAWMCACVCVCELLVNGDVQKTARTPATSRQKYPEMARVRSCIAGALCVVLVIKKCYGEGYVLC